MNSQIGQEKRKWIFSKNRRGKFAVATVLIIVVEVFLMTSIEKMTGEGSGLVGFMGGGFWPFAGIVLLLWSLYIVDLLLPRAEDATMAQSLFRIMGIVIGGIVIFAVVAIVTLTFMGYQIAIGPGH